MEYARIFNQSIGLQRLHELFQPLFLQEVITSAGYNDAVVEMYTKNVEEIFLTRAIRVHSKYHLRI